MRERHSGDAVPCRRVWDREARSSPACGWISQDPSQYVHRGWPARCIPSRFLAPDRIVPGQYGRASARGQCACEVALVSLEPEKASCDHLLALPGARPTDSRPRPCVAPDVVAGQRVPVLAMRLALEGRVLGMGDDLQMIRVPAGIDTASVMELLALR